MGLNPLNLVKDKLTNIGKGVAKQLDYTSALFTHPIKFIKNPKKTTDEFFKQSLTKRVVDVGLATAGYTSAILGAGAVTGATKAGTLAGTATNVAKKAIVGTGKAIGKAFVAHPISTSAGVLVGAPIVAGAIYKKPELLTTLPQKGFETGQKIVDVVEEHPLGAGLLGGVAGGVALYEGYDYLKDKLGGGDNVPVVQNIPMGGGSITEQTPLTAQVNEVTPTGEKKPSIRRYTKRKTKKEVPTIVNNIKIDDRDIYSHNGKIFKHHRRRKSK